MSRKLQNVWWVEREPYCVYSGRRSHEHSWLWRSYTQDVGGARVNRAPDSDRRGFELEALNDWQTQNGLPRCGLCLVMHEKLNGRVEEMVDGLGQLPICVLRSIILWSIVMASPQQTYNTMVAYVYRLRGLFQRQHGVRGLRGQDFQTTPMWVRWRRLLCFLVMNHKPRLSLRELALAHWLGLGWCTTAQLGSYLDC